MFNPDAILTSYSALVIVRSHDRFLLIQEYRNGQQWYIPAGKIEAGEQFTVAARREALIKAGIPIEFEGILRIEYSSKSYGNARLRVTFLARPADDRPLKNWPDEHSLQALWVTLAELDNFPLRNQEIAEIFRYVTMGGPAYPLHLITAEGAPWLETPITGPC